MGLSPSRVHAVVGPAVVDYFLGLDLRDGGPMMKCVARLTGIAAIHPINWGG